MDAVFYYFWYDVHIMVGKNYNMKKEVLLANPQRR